jgi:hypothetical protein
VVLRVAAAGVGNARDPNYTKSWARHFDCLSFSVEPNDASFHAIACQKLASIFSNDYV